MSAVPPTEVTPAISFAEVPFEIDPSAVLRRFSGASQLELPSEHEVDLSTPFDDSEVELLPSGEPYVPHGRYRERLNDTLGPGQWALLPLAEHQQDLNERRAGKTKKFVVQQWGLFVRGHLVAISWGESGAETADSTLAQMLEAAKSNALTRTCKDLGIGLLLADKRWGSAFRERCGLLVEAKTYASDNFSQLWRRADGVPFPYEGKVFRQPGGFASAGAAPPAPPAGAQASASGETSEKEPGADETDLKADDDYLGAMAAQRQRVGTETYLKVLAMHGVTAAGQVRGRAHRTAVYRALESLPTPPPTQN